MKSENYSTRVMIPSVDDFAKRFPQFGNKAGSTGSRLFDLVMQPATFVNARAITDGPELPAVTAIARECSALMNGRIEGPDKQLVGALVCSLMEANGYEKRDLKRAVPVDGWRTGEVYRRR